MSERSNNWPRTTEYHCMTFKCLKTSAAHLHMLMGGQFSQQLYLPTHTCLEEIRHVTKEPSDDDWKYFSFEYNNLTKCDLLSFQQIRPPNPLIKAKKPIRLSVWNLKTWQTFWSSQRLDVISVHVLKAWRADWESPIGLGNTGKRPVRSGEWLGWAVCLLQNTLQAPLVVRLNVWQWNEEEREQKERKQ